MYSELTTLPIQIWKEEGILYCAFAERSDITLPIAKQCVKKRIEFCEGISYPCLLDIRGLRSVSREARGYLAEEGSLLIKAGAFLINSWLTTMLGNIFLTINKPKVPTKLFSDEGAAITWLKKYL